MSDDHDHPVSAGLDAVRSDAPDPRLERWAAGELSEAERQDLREAARTDADLAAQLERLEPLEDGLREAMFGEAMAALLTAGQEPRPSAVVLPIRHRWRVVAMAAAALAAGGVIAFVALPRSTSFEVIARPAIGQSFEATETVTLTLRTKAGREDLGIFVSDQGRVDRVDLAWEVRGDQMSVEAPAHLFTAGHFGDVVVVVGPGTAPSVDDLSARPFVRLPVVVRTPSYALREAVAALAEEQRSIDDIVDDSAIALPEGATRISLTLRPEFTVRSGVQACVFVDGPGGLRPLDEPCAAYDNGLVRTPITLSQLPAAEGGTLSLVFVIGPAHAGMTVDGARAAVEASANTHGWRVVRVPLRPRPGPTEP